MKNKCMVAALFAGGITLMLTASGIVYATVVSMESREAPASIDTESKQKLLATASTSPLQVLPDLPAVKTEERFLAKGASFDGRDAMSFGRTPGKFGIDGRVALPSGANSVRVRVNSIGALHLRTAWRFEDDSQYEVTILDGNGSAPPLTNRSEAMGGGDSRVIWSAISLGATQEVLITRDGPLQPWGISLERVAHFDQSVAAISAGVSLPKLFGDSAPCQRDIACVLDAADTVDPGLRPAMLNMTRAVALMITTTSTGSSFSCTGTLLNSANYPVPLFLTAYHCMVGAVALDTIWFYSRTACGYGSPSTSAQVTGGSVTLWSSQALDSELLGLKQMPPAGAAYAGWNAKTMSVSEPILATHHPRADVKKGSIGTVTGANTQALTFTGLGTYPPGTFYTVNWDVGIVEHGSSGSGLFSLDSTNPFTFRLRGTLTGGNNSCLNNGSTYYSRLDRIFPNIAEPLTVPVVLPVINAAAVEYFHTAFGHYFVTVSPDEIAKLDSGVFAGWARTGQSFKVHPLGTSGTAGVCRFFTTAFAPKSSHFYTPSASECATVKANPKWTYEALVFGFTPPSAAGACPASTQALYRLYNNGKSGAPNHRYTTSTTIRAQMLAQGWIPEGSGSLGVIGCVPT